MIFNSAEFMIFFPIVVIIYYIIPKSIRYIWLLIASWYFYMNWNPVYILLLLSCTIVTYMGAILVEKLDSTKWRKGIFIACVLICLGILAFFKYLNFMLLNINRILSVMHMGTFTLGHSVVLPVGISFYTLQAIGYLIDVYRGDTYAEKNFLYYALFISFFPQLVAGPIERSKNLLIQLHEPRSLTWDGFRKGTLLMLWGLFLKLVIADRAAIIVNTVYGDSFKYQGFYIIVATVLFSVQIYCDFYGYSIIAKGAALIMGIELMDNFYAPYFSRSVKEFWRRWHISLSGWFRDYLYIPLGGSRKGWRRKQRNLLAVFAVSGLWHGASIAFVVWGMLNGIYQILSNVRDAVKEHLQIKREVRDTFSKRLLQRVVTFVLVSFAWMFFRAGDMSAALNTISNMCHANWMVLFDGSLYHLGVQREFFLILIATIAFLLFVDYKRYKEIDIFTAIARQEWWFRVGIYLGLIFAIILFGCYGVEYDISEFIYFQF